MLRIGYSHDWWMDSGAQLTFFAQATHSSDYWLSIWNVGCYESVRTQEQVCGNGDKVEAWTTVDLNLRWTSPKANWYMEGFVTNATDEVYKTSIRRQTNDFVSGFAYNLPRMYGVRAGFEF
jgi:hypothetical protein